MKKFKLYTGMQNWINKKKKVVFVLLLPLFGTLMFKHFPNCLTSVSLTDKKNDIQTITCFTLMPSSAWEVTTTEKEMATLWVQGQFIHQNTSGRFLNFLLNRFLKKSGLWQNLGNTNCKMCLLVVSFCPQFKNEWCLICPFIFKFFQRIGLNDIEFESTGWFLTIDVFEIEICKNCYEQNPTVICNVYKRYWISACICDTRPLSNTKKAWMNE